jgi:hypothetical protein
MRVVLTAGPTTMTARARGSTPGRRCRRMLPSSDEFHDLGSAFFRGEEEGEEDDSDSLRERDNDKGTMMTTNDCSGRGRRNAEG